jgi:hypothetical protein
MITAWRKMGWKYTSLQTKTLIVVAMLSKITFTLAALVFVHSFVSRFFTKTEVLSIMALLFSWQINGAVLPLIKSGLKEAVLKEFNLF